MYNLLIVGADGYWDDRDISSYEYDRFLSYTPQHLRARFLAVEPNEVGHLTAIPALIGYEFNRRAPAESDEVSPYRVGKIVEITRRVREVEFKYKFDEKFDPIPTRVIREWARDLDIDVSNNENYRGHWAVKDIDLLKVLKEKGVVERNSSDQNRIAQELSGLRSLSPTTSAKPKIFVVHGRDDSIKNEVRYWLVKGGLDDIVLHDQANLGRTLITKFSEFGSQAVFAIILMTPDDVGGLAGKEQKHRARQNVIFEMGYFFAKLDPSRVAVLMVGDIEKPSDLSLIHI